MPQVRQSFHTGLPNKIQDPSNQKIVPASSKMSWRRLFFNMASIVGSWITPSIKESISGGSSAAAHQYKLASDSVIGSRLRGGHTSGSRSPVRGLEKRGLRSTNKKLPEPNIIDQPQGLKVASGLESVDTIQLQQDQDLAERFMVDEVLAHSIHEANAWAHPSRQNDLMLAIDLAGGSIQDYTNFTRQESETREAVLLAQNRLDIQQAQTFADRQVALDLQRILDMDLGMAATTSQADKGLAIRLHEEPSLFDKDYKLAQKLQSEFDERAAHAERARKQENSNCVACGEEFAKAAMFGVCEHQYCRQCLIGMCVYRPSVYLDPRH